MKHKPNILIIVIDSVRADHLPCYGYARTTAPNITRLADEGCVFDRVISAAPFSPASYASIFSNLHPHQHGVNGDTVRIWPGDWPTLPQRMHDRGYFTFGISNNSFVSEQTHADRGFDVFHGPCERWILGQYNRLYGRVRKYLGEGAAQRMDSSRMLSLDKGDSGRAIRLAQRCIENGRKPFFGFVILMDPHALYNPRRREFCGHTRHVRDFLKNINGRKMYARLMAHRTSLPPELLQVAHDLYDAEIKHADRWVGRMYEELRDRGLLEDTVLIVCADHGEGFGERGVWGHGFSLNDFMTRVPLIVRSPSHWTPGSRCGALVPLHAIHELCLDLTDDDGPKGTSPPSGLLRAEDPTWRGAEAVFSEFPIQTGTLQMFANINPRFDGGRWAGAMQAVRTKDWRYIAYETGEIELFDLNRDPGETVSVHGQHPEVVKELAGRLRTHLEDRRVDGKGEAKPSSEPLDASVLERLRGLGYID